MTDVRVFGEVGRRVVAIKPGGKLEAEMVDVERDELSPTDAHAQPRRPTRVKGQHALEIVDEVMRVEFR